MCRKHPTNKMFCNCCILMLLYTCSTLNVSSTLQFSLIAPPVSSRLVMSVLSWLSSICVQVLRAVTSSSTTCHRSSPTLRYCRCSCPSETSSLRRSLLTAPPTRVNASVSNCDGNVRDSYCRLLVFRDFLYMRNLLFIN